jgi:hypothetical protein
MVHSYVPDVERKMDLISIEIPLLYNSVYSDQIFKKQNGRTRYTLMEMICGTQKF